MECRFTGRPSARENLKKEKNNNLVLNKQLLFFFPFFFCFQVFFGGGFFVFGLTGNLIIPAPYLL